MGCSVYKSFGDAKRSQIASPASTAPWVPRGAESDDAATATAAAASMDASTPVASADASTTPATGNAGGAPSVDPTQQMPAIDKHSADLDAGPDSEPAAADRMALDATQKDAAVPAADAGHADMKDAGHSEPGHPTGPTDTAASSCTRERLVDDAKSYLKALASGDKRSLDLHPNARYTENGRTESIGLGMWLDHPQAKFARHVLDASSCSTLTEAVLSESTGRVVLGLRLRYVERQLLEIEAQVVTPNDQYWAPDQIIVSGTDPWVEPIPDSERSSSAELTRLAMNYFASTADASLLPPHAADCKRRQNGALMPNGGSCGTPGTQRFQQQRYPVVDETAGIVTAVIKYSDYIGMYLIKVRAGTIEDVEVVGGASSTTTGW